MTATLLQSRWLLNITLMLLEAKSVASSHFFLVNRQRPEERDYLGMLLGDLSSEIFWSAGTLNMNPPNFFPTRVNPLTLVGYTLGQ